MRTHFVDQEFGQAMGGTTYLCSSMSGSLTRKLDAGGWNNLRALLPPLTADSRSWLRFQLERLYVAFLCGLVIL